MTLNTVTGDGMVKEIHIKAGPENHWMNYIKPSRLMVLFYNGTGNVVSLAAPRYRANNLGPRKPFHPGYAI